MVHALLRTSAVALAAAGAALAGTPAGAAAQAAEEAGRPHEDVTCAACHRGGSADREVGTVPEASCTRAGCHPDGGPKRVTVSTVSFEHRGHARESQVELTCAGCHGHASGERPLGATLEACDVCHADELGGGRPGECLSCHQDPAHVPVTNQGVSIPHSSLPGVQAPLPWVAEECVRCHYDVGRPSLDVPLARCNSCHDRLMDAAAGGIGTDLHPEHEGVNCMACHESGGHRVRAMSTAVEIECGGCHGESHGLRTGGGGRRGAGVPTALCTSCHRDTHAPAQRLLLGALPGGDVQPSYKFEAGLTCTSCHTSGGDGEPGPDADGPELVPCTSCHRSEYRQVLDWWRAGSRQRLSRATEYLETAARRLGPSAPDSAARLLSRARRSLEAVDAGAPVHNVRATDRAARGVIADVERAYGLAGLDPAPAPELGRPPRPGFCSYCHYSLDEERPLNEMPLDFHREVMDGG